MDKRKHIRSMLLVHAIAAQTQKNVLLPPSNPIIPAAKAQEIIDKLVKETGFSMEVIVEIGEDLLPLDFSTEPDEEDIAVDDPDVIERQRKMVMTKWTVETNGRPLSTFDEQRDDPIVQRIMHALSFIPNLSKRFVVATLLAKKAAQQGQKPAAVSPPAVEEVIDIPTPLELREVVVQLPGVQTRGQEPPSASNEPAELPESYTESKLRAQVTSQPAPDAAQKPVQQPNEEEEEKMPYKGKLATLYKVTGAEWLVMLEVVVQFLDDTFRFPKTGGAAKKAWRALKAAGHPVSFVMMKNYTGNLRNIYRYFHDEKDVLTPHLKSNKGFAFQLLRKVVDAGADWEDLGLEGITGGTASSRGAAKKAKAPRVPRRGRKSTKSDTSGQDQSLEHVDGGYAAPGFDLRDTIEALKARIASDAENLKTLEGALEVMIQMKKGKRSKKK